jgi:hypothetical protein
MSKQTDYYVVTVEHDGVQLFGAHPKVWETRSGHLVDGIPRADATPERKHCIKGVVRGEIPLRAKQLYRFFRDKSTFGNVRLKRVTIRH